MLVLWDIDGTLISTGGAGEDALGEAVRRCFDAEGLDGVEIAGRTDRAIAEQICRAHGRPIARAGEILAAYLAALPTALAARNGRVHPGVDEILRAVGGQSGVNGLLTGNLEEGARLKLGRYGLRGRFAFGAYGGDTADRTLLAARALERAREKNGPAFDPAGAWVVGDTPHDVACARAVGCRALAVATGRHTLPELLACRPDAAFEDLSDLPAVMARLSAPR